MLEKIIVSEDEIRNFLVNEKGFSRTSVRLDTFTVGIKAILEKGRVFNVVEYTAKVLNILPSVVRFHYYRERKTNKKLQNYVSGKNLLYALADEFKEKSNL